MKLLEVKEDRPGEGRITLQVNTQELAGMQLAIDYYQGMVIPSLLPNAGECIRVLEEAHRTLIAYPPPRPPVACRERRNGGAA